MDSMLQDMRDYASRRVAEGFESESGIVQGVVEYLLGEHPREQLEAHAPRIVRESLEAHRRVQETWEGPTDCDRLDRAFDALEEQGIVARQNFT